MIMLFMFQLLFQLIIALIQYIQHFLNAHILQSGDKVVVIFFQRPLTTNKLHQRFIDISIEIVIHGRILGNHIAGQRQRIQGKYHLAVIIYARFQIGLLPVCQLFTIKGIFKS